MLVHTQLERESSGTRSRRVAWAARALRHQEMPLQEISAVLSAQDQETRRRYLELHRERLRERLSDQLRTLDRLERLLSDRV